MLQFAACDAVVQIRATDASGNYTEQTVSVTVQTSVGTARVDQKLDVSETAVHEWGRLGLIKKCLLRPL